MNVHPISIVSLISKSAFKPSWRFVYRYLDVPGSDVAKFSKG